MSNDLVPSGQPNRVILYHADDRQVTANVFFARDKFWLPQPAIADLFGVRIAALSKRLKNIYESDELAPAATVSQMETVQTEGGRQPPAPTGEVILYRAEHQRTQDSAATIRNFRIVRQKGGPDDSVRPKP